MGNECRCAIQALLTDVYMWKKDYAKALESSQTLISLSYKYDVSAANASDYKKIFLDPAGTKEAIWSLHWDYTTGWWKWYKQNRLRR